MTTSAQLAAAQDAIARTMKTAGYSNQAIEKAMKLLKNRAPSCAPASAPANTDTNTNTFSEIDQDGRMLDLTAGTPAGWVIEQIKDALKARDIPEDQWGRAWAWFRSWNLDSQGKARIAMRALKGWLRTCKLGITRKLAAKPTEQKAKAVRPEPPVECSNGKLWDYCVARSGSLSQMARQKLGGKYFERLRELTGQGVSPVEAACRVHYGAILTGELDV